MLSYSVIYSKFYLLWYPTIKYFSMHHYKKHFPHSQNIVTSNKSLTSPVNLSDYLNILFPQIYILIISYTLLLLFKNDPKFLDRVD